jgi:hypothetical protein
MTTCENQYVVRSNALNLGPTRAGANLKEYIDKINAKTAIIEKNYIDKDYLLDYSGYYSRSFQNFGRYTERVHLFKIDFCQEDFEAKIENGDVDELIESYLGFIVLKPFIDKINNPEPSIGRTLLVPPNNDEGNQYVKGEYNANLFGIPLKINTLPYQAKDHAISVCATIALWIANNKLNSLFQTPLCSPLEITNKATSLIESSRKIPNDGLTIRQILAFLRKMDLEYNSISINEIRGLVKKQVERKEIISDIVRAHIYSLKLPVIASLSMLGDQDSLLDAHTVVISGYEDNAQGKIECLYVHDDEFGPYCKIKNCSPDMDFYYWDCKWTKSHEEPDDINSINIFYNFNYEKVMLDVITIPLYPKIRLCFSEIYEEVIKRRSHDRHHSCYPFLSTIQDYKSSLIKINFQDKSTLLKKQMPRFIWVIRTQENRDGRQYIVRDDLFDATSHMIINLGTIKYTDIIP